MRKLTLIFFFLFLFFFCAPKVSAVVDPLASPNNRYGIHILDASDITDAKNLVNSTGGDWGYVTLVIREDERYVKLWQRVFDELRRSHLIPIVRLATRQEGQGWKKFDEGDFENWVYFLNSLNWVIKNRYVIFANEPNHASEWGGEVNPEEYARLLCSFSSKLKSSSGDFFVLPAALDASAPTSKGYMKEEEYLIKMKNEKNFFECIDGWTSHSYPNPNFSASEKESGKISIKTYKWELNFLKNLGLGKTLPVFITETGWKHTVNTKKEKLLEPGELTEKYKYAFENVWTDKEIVAITPFVLNYQEDLFNNFSWKREDGSFYPFYQSVQEIPKVKGTPQLEDKGEIVFFIGPTILEEGARGSGYLFIKNEGQAIWTPEDTKVNISFQNEGGISVSISSSLEPKKTQFFSVNFPTPEYQGSLWGKLVIERNGKKISSEYRFEIYQLKKDKGILASIVEVKNILVGWVTQKAKNILK